MDLVKDAIKQCFTLEFYRKYLSLIIICMFIILIFDTGLLGRSYKGFLENKIPILSPELKHVLNYISDPHSSQQTPIWIIITLMITFIAMASLLSISIQVILSYIINVDRNEIIILHLAVFFKLIMFSLPINIINLALFINNYEIGIKIPSHITPFIAVFILASVSLNFFVLCFTFIFGEEPPTKSEELIQ